MKNEFVEFEEIKIFGIPVLVEYVKNESKGIVVALAVETDNLALMACDKALEGSVVQFNILKHSKFSKVLHMQNTYAGVARCFKGDKDNPPDKFDVKVGMEIARNKLVSKLEKVVFNRKKYLANYVRSLADSLVK